MLAYISLLKPQYPNIFHMQRLALTLDFGPCVVVGAGRFLTLVEVEISEAN